MEFNFIGGVPKTQNRKVELYPDTAVMTVSYTGEKGAGRKFSFNTKATELLSLEENSAIAFDFNAKAIANVDFESAFTVSKNKPYSFNDRKLFEYFVKNESANETGNTEYVLSAVDDIKVATFSLMKYYKDEVEVDVVEESEAEMVNMEATAVESEESKVESEETVVESEF